MRPRAVVVIFSALASLCVAGCAQYLPDQDSLDWSQHVVTTDAGGAESGAKNGAISTHESDTKEARATLHRGQHGRMRSGV